MAKLSRHDRNRLLIALSLGLGITAVITALALFVPNDI